MFPLSGKPISRRSFLKTAAGTAAAIAMGASALATTSCSPAAVEASSSSEEVVGAAASASSWAPELKVPESSVFTTEDCEYMEDVGGAISMARQVSLPYGTMLWADDSNVAVCLLPCKTSDPLTQVGILSLADGSTATVLENAVGRDDGFQIFDARGNASGLVWVESDVLSSRWRVYSAQLNGKKLGDAALAYEGDGDWEMPSLAVTGEYAFWQLVPRKDGSSKNSASVVMRIPFGGDADSAYAMFESAGRMASNLTSTATGIVVTPRLAGSQARYQLDHIDAATAEVTSSMNLPATMKPTYASYGETGFSFSFEDIYNVGDGISNLGTYTENAVGVSPKGSGGKWFRFPRTPLTDPAWCNGWFIVKSTSVVAGIDTVNKKYFTISPELVTQNYGEFLASSGNVDRFVTYSNVSYTPLGGSKIEQCNVRIWETEKII